MSERLPPPSSRSAADVAAEAPRTALPFEASWKLAGTLAAVMVALALLGVGIATLSAPLARNYWMTLIPIYGVLCTVAAWWRSQQAGEAGGGLVLRQALHWLAIGAAVLLDFSIRGAEADPQISSGFNALLLLALGCFLAGVHLDWSFAGVGLLLALALVIAAKAEQYLWLLFLAGILVAAALLGARRLFGGGSARGGASP